MRVVVALFMLAVASRAGSIRDVDFKNFVYPFTKNKFLSVPSRLRWLPLHRADFITTQNGQHTFPCDEPPCRMLTVDDVNFGEIRGIPQTSGIVTTTFHTGGTATWQYLYVITLSSEKPKVVTWLETGSRGYMGLRRLAFDRGDLVLIVNDPDKRQGDCCSTGTITYRYRWAGGSFHNIGPPTRKDDP
jgi:hypothetical protein